MIKRIVLTISLFALLLLLTVPVFAKEGLVKFKSNIPGKKTISVVLEVAVTDEEKAKGLMNRSHLASNRGMVFIFRPAKQITFWMKDTLISLDMIFINKGKIVHIVKNAEPNQTQIVYPSVFDTSEVVEVNGGFADKYMIDIGNEVIFKNIPK